MNDLNKNEKILIEEIKIIQDIIKRMADNSFKIKAWAITLVVATLLIKTNIHNAYIALIPLLTFWFLDAYYLQQEKIFREIYKDKDRSRYLPTVELQDGTEAIASAIFIYDPLFYTSRLVCRQDARISISCVEEQSKRS